AVRGVGQAAVAGVFGVKEADTEGVVMLEDLGLAAPGRVQYQPSGNTWLWRALRGMPVTHDDVFLDYGAGKGRGVVQAALRYRFRKVIGVEISEHLAEIARHNVERLAPRLRVPEVEIIVADAVDWPVPDDVTYIYMYRPVKGPLLESVLTRIDESFD